MQEACLQLLRGAERYDASVPFAAWLGRLVHLACLRVRRARRRRREVPVPDATAPQPQPMPPEPLPAERVRDALEALPERYRAPIELHYFGGLDYRSAATALGLSGSAFGMRLHRARELLRARLTRAGAGVDASLVVAALSSQPGPAATPAVHGAIASLARTPLSALPTTTVPLGLVAGGAALMAAHPLVTIALAAALLAGSVAVPIVMRADDAAAPPPVAVAAPRAALAGVEASLAQLAAWQSPDGSWDATALAARGIGEAGEPPLRSTALAMLCFLGAGYDQITPNRYHALMRRATSWLLGRQRGDGSFADGVAEDALISTPLFEAYAMTGDPALEEPAQRCIVELLARRRRVSGCLVWTVPSPEGEVVDVRALKWCQFAAGAALAGQVAGADVQARTELGRWIRATWAAANADPGHGARFPARVRAADGARLGEDDAVAAALDIAAFGGVHRPDAMIDPLLDALDDPARMTPDDLESAATAVFRYERDDQRFLPIRGGFGAPRRDLLTTTAYRTLVEEVFCRYAQIGANAQAPTVASPQPTLIPLPHYAQ